MASVPAEDTRLAGVESACPPDMKSVCDELPAFAQELKQLDHKLQAGRDECAQRAAFQAAEAVKESWDDNYRKALRDLRAVMLARRPMAELFPITPAQRAELGSPLPDGLEIRGLHPDEFVIRSFTREMKHHIVTNYGRTGAIDASGDNKRPIEVADTAGIAYHQPLPTEMCEIIHKCSSLALPTLIVQSVHSHFPGVRAYFDNEVEKQKLSAQKAEVLSLLSATLDDVASSRRLIAELDQKRKDDLRRFEMMAKQLHDDGQGLLSYGKQLREAALYLQDATDMVNTVACKSLAQEILKMLSDAGELKRAADGGAPPSSSLPLSPPPSSSSASSSASSSTASSGESSGEKEEFTSVEIVPRVKKHRWYTAGWL
jgi:hypothetical protein